jgi:hypothetical protein
LYKFCASQSGLKGAKVVAEMAPLSGSEITVYEMGVTTEETIADPIAVERLSQEEWHGVTHRVSLKMLKLRSTLRKMMKHQSARAMKKIWNLQLTQLLMHRSAQVAKAMRLMRSPLIGYSV